MHYTHRLLLIGASLLLSIYSMRAQAFFSGGDGSKENPFQISTEQDLRTLSQEVNMYSNTYLGKYFIQTSDITFSNDTPLEPIGFVLLGSETPEKFYFQGTYDGGMKKIYNLNINDSSELKGGASSHTGIGLFGNLGPGATIKNIVIASGTLYAHSMIGGIAGNIHDNVSIYRCKVGPDVRIHAVAMAGGITGSSMGQNMSFIRECANYASIYVYGSGVHKVAGGIIGSTANTCVEGCANFGDVWSKSGFAGGIIGYYPLSNPPLIFDYPEIKSCMNAGDITTTETIAGGIIGCVGYNLQDGLGNPIPHQQISNSYSYGQTFEAFSRSFGPIVSLFLRATPITVSKTYYDKDRYFHKKKTDDPNSEMAFTLGEPKSHDEVLSPEFITLLNEGGSHPFEADRYKINAGMPILKWINDTYDPEIDKANQYRTDRKFSVAHRRAGNFFPPNRSGEFLIYNMDMQEPSVAAKSVGYSKDCAWSDRVLAIAGGKSYTYFMSSSDFRPRIMENGMYQPKPRTPQTADHWIITPAFRVDGTASWFHWVAASEDANHPSSYQLYITSDENATTPDAFAQSTPIFTMDKEASLVKKRETIEGEERSYFILNDHKVDLSAYAGKVVRLAFRDTSTDQFNLLIGQMKMAQANGVDQILVSPSDFLFSVDGRQIAASGEGYSFQIFTIGGESIAFGDTNLVKELPSGLYIVKATDPQGFTSTQKVIIP